jgi:alpha-galactosidase
VLATPAAALDHGLAKTPPMGWNSWYAARCSPTEQLMRANADALVDTGLARLGYRYVNVDDCWMGLQRDASDRLTSNPDRFPGGIRALASYVHSRGLKFGLYTSAGPTTCNHPFPASYRHYPIDFKTFASWKVDYVKVDWCSAPPDNKIVATYKKISAAHLKAGRRMIMTVSTPGFHKVWQWGHRYGNTWRIAADAGGTWDSVVRTLDADAPLWRYAGPDRGWNDPDMLQVGNRALTPTEEVSHFSLWSMLAAPLLIGYDLPSMPAASREVLANKDVIAVDQDRLGRQGRRLARRDGVETWLRPLSGGDYALLLFNRGSSDATASAVVSSLSGVRSRSSYKLRDLWSGARKTVRRGRAVKATLPAHGVVMWRVTPSSR